jgi:hypothetical protein
MSYDPSGQFLSCAWGAGMTSWGAKRPEVKDSTPVGGTRLKVRLHLPTGPGAGGARGLGGGRSEATRPAVSVAGARRVPTTGHRCSRCPRAAVHGCRITREWCRFGAGSAAQLGVLRRTPCTIHTSYFTSLPAGRSFVTGLLSSGSLVRSQYGSSARSRTCRPSRSSKGQVLSVALYRVALKHC